MPETQYLDLDALATPEVTKKIRIGGQDHEFREPSLQVFIDETQRAQKLDERYGDGSVPAHVLVEQMVEFIRACFPTIPASALHGMPVRNLRAIREFITAEISPDEAARAAGNGAAATDRPSSTSAS